MIAPLYIRSKDAADADDYCRLGNGERARPLLRLPEGTLVETFGAVVWLPDAQVPATPREQRARHEAKQSQARRDFLAELAAAHPDMPVPASAG